MSKRLGIIVTFCCVLALCFALGGCGGVDKKAFTGTWDLESGSDESLSADSVELMKSLGLEVTLTMNEDGTGSLNLFGEVTELTWEANSNSDGTVKINDNTAAVKLVDGKLILEDSSGASMTFVKPSSSASAASASASASSAATGSESATSADSTGSESATSAGSASSESASDASESSSAAASESSANEEKPASEESASSEAA